MATVITINSSKVAEYSLSIPSPIPTVTSKVVKKEMAQGQKQSRFIAWSFMDDAKRRRPF